ncbi:MAG: hypothetical protein RLZZ501_994, partial [Pseudomonadota bacterium]
MLSQIGGGIFLCGLIEITLAVAAFLVLWRWSPRLDPDRRRAALLLFLWCLLATVDYWLLGPRSFVMVNDEGEFSLPL